jgi:hypothetical protein
MARASLDGVVEKALGWEILEVLVLGLEGERHAGARKSRWSGAGGLWRLRV